MARIRGGMEFRQGAIVRLPAPPRTLTAQPIRLLSRSAPRVELGEAVRHGQVLADAGQPDRPCVISPIHGRVQRIWTVPAEAGGGWGILIEPTEPTATTMLSVEPPRGRTSENWLEALRRFGPWCEGDWRLDLVAQLHAVQKHPATMLICVGLDAFPPYPDRSSLLTSFPDDAVLGTQIAADIVGARRVLMLTSQASAVVSRVKPACRNFRVPLTAVTNLYPSADPRLVLWVHGPGRHKKLGPNALPTDRGVVMIGPWTAIRLARWFTNRELDLAQPLFIGWPEPGTPMTPAYVLAGQPLASVHGALAGSAGALVGRVVRGNPMTGQPFAAEHDGNGALDPVVPTDELLLSVLAPMRPPKPEPCISCGWCAQVCPTELRPVRLVQLLTRAKTDRHAAQRTRRALEWCIDCGLCSHVCPTELPLAQSLRAARDNAETAVSLPVASEHGNAG